MSLRLRKVTGHPQATDAYRVIYRPDDGTPELAVGSIGLKTSAHQRRYWEWGIYTVVERPPFRIDGEAADREDAMTRFRATWEVFASDPPRLAAFVATLRAATR